VTETEPTLTIDAVNQLDREAFVATFGHVFEATPSLAAVAWESRPFADRAAMVQAFSMAADQLDDAHQLALLRSHPPLATAAAMTATSRHEQHSAGLTDLDEEMQIRMERANARYLDRFGFPFIIAVGGLGPAEIALALAERLGHDDVEERAAALGQVKRIAELRITRMISL
jgi:2-oxo-4-hydroxy-4-carboxy-5-ureidoimidazoline decarboxylase